MAFYEQQSVADNFTDYLSSPETRPLFICGEARRVLSTLPANSVDFCMTSPPYWHQREYQNGGIGLEPDPQTYADNLLLVFAALQRILKPTGSFWLNLGDSYENKGLLGLPWRIALRMMDEQNWILRNDVIWNKIKGPDNSLDKLRNTHEYIFHFVLNRQNYYYNIDAIRSKPRQAYIRNGAVVSATGVSGIRYRRQIELSTALTADEKSAAFRALEATLARVARGELSDFRMVIRKQQRTTHSNSEKVSGRARELAQCGFYFLFYNPNGSKPGDVWDIVPEDTMNRADHYAAFPEDLVKIPLLATCPESGIVLDPFCGTGTTNYVAMNLNRKSIGIDLSDHYLEIAEDRCARLL